MLLLECMAVGRGKERHGEKEVEKDVMEREVVEEAMEELDPCRTCLQNDVVEKTRTFSHEQQPADSQCVCLQSIVSFFEFRHFNPD